MKPMLRRAGVPHEQALLAKEPKPTTLTRRVVIFLTLFLMLILFSVAVFNSAFAEDSRDENTPIYDLKAPENEELLDNTSKVEDVQEIKASTVEEEAEEPSGNKQVSTKETVRSETDLDAALANFSTNEIIVDAPITLTGSFEGLVSGNKILTGSSSGALIRDVTNTGALITVSAESELTIKSLVISGTQTEVADVGPLLDVQSTAAVILAVGAKLQDNIATVGEGGAVCNAGSIRMQNGCTISGNSNIGQTPKGGGVYNKEGATLIVKGGSISGNAAHGAGGQGGGIYLQKGSEVIFGAATIKNNSASQGGGIYTQAHCVFDGTEIVGNSAVAEDNSAESGCGGGIFSSGATTLTLNDTTVSKNEAEAYTDAHKPVGGHGGGVFVGNESTLSLKESSLVTRNNAVEGGGVYVASGGAFAMTGKEEFAPAVSKNTATGLPDHKVEGKGGGIANNGSLSIEVGSLTQNTSTDFGGGLEQGGTASLGLLTMSENSAHFGGGIHNLENKTTHCDSSVIRENDAQCGGGILNQGTVHLKGTTVLDKNTSQQKAAGNNFMNLWMHSFEKPVLSVEGDVTITQGLLLAANPETGERNGPIVVAAPLTKGPLIVDGYGHFINKERINAGLDLGDVVASANNSALDSNDLSVVQLSTAWPEFKAELSENKEIVCGTALVLPTEAEETQEAQPTSESYVEEEPVEASDPLAVAAFSGALAVAGLGNVVITRLRRMTWL